MEEHKPQATTSADPVPGSAEAIERTDDEADRQAEAEAQRLSKEEAQQKAGAERQGLEAGAKLKAGEEARQLAEKGAADKQTEEERLTREEREREVAEQEKQRLAAQARQREEAEAASRNEAVQRAAGGGATDKEGTRNRAVKELKAALDEHRKRYNRGKKIWRVWSLLSLHLFILSIAGAIFVYWAKLGAHNLSVTNESRSDIVFGLIIIAVVSLILFLEYLRNWWKFRLRVTHVDKQIIELTKPDVDLNTVRTTLGKIIEKHLNFIGSITDINN